MIRKIKIFSMLLLLLTSCSKSMEDETPISKPISVTFNLNPLTVNVEPLSSKARVQTRAANTADVVSSISYYIYNATTSNIVAKGSSSYTPGVDAVPVDFGKVTIKLVPGTYKVIFYAQGKGKGYFYANNFSDKLYYDSYFKMSDKEVFYYTGDLTVSAESTNFDINLPRMGGLMRVNILDDLIPDVKKVTVTISEYNRWYCLGSSGTDLQYFVTNTYEATLGATKMDVFDYYVTRPQNITVTIKVLGVNDVVLFEKQLTVPIYDNRRSIISGNLFSTIGNKDLTITVNDLWGEDNNINL